MRSIRDIILSILLTGFCIAIAVVPFVYHIDTKITIFSAIIAAVMIIITGVELYEFILQHKKR